MAVTWTLLSAKPVGNGGVMSLTWEVQGDPEDIGENPNWDTSFQLEAGITGDTYVFNKNNQNLGVGYALFSSGVLGEWKRTLSGDVATAVFTMRFSVRHPGANLVDPWEVPINSRLYSAFVQVAINDVKLRFHDGAPDRNGPPSATSIAVDAADMGMLPRAANLKFFVDAHAESVAQELQQVSTIATWSNLVNSAAPLSSPDGNRPTLTSGNGATPRMDFSGGTKFMAMDSSDVPAITHTATIAAMFRTSSTTSPHHIIGRWNSGDADAEAWRFYFDGSGGSRKLVYQTKAGGVTKSLTYQLQPDDTTVVFLFRRKPDPVNEGAVIHDMWINGRHTAGSGEILAEPDAGSGTLTLGARFNGSTWTDAFNGRINQAAIYDAFVTDAEASLIMHTIAHRTAITLGSPIPEEENWRTQPYPESNRKIGKPSLGRKPIVRILLFSGRHQDNPYGQSRVRWRLDSQAEIEQALKREVAAALNACDDFEIMFNLPGGNYKGGGIFHSDVFTSGMNRGIAGDQPMIREDMWDAMANVWLAFNLGEASPVNGYGVPRNRKRRGWFYTGSGFAMEPDATLTPTGHMNERNIGPATGEVYHDLLMENWADRDPGDNNRYRCFMLDQAGVWRGMLIQLCRSAKMQDEGFVFAGEAIASGDDTARFGAVWFGVLDFDRAPWWVRDETPAAPYNRLNGYNTEWNGSWSDEPVYFGVNRSRLRVANPGNPLEGKRSYPYLYAPPSPPPDPWSPGQGENMKLGDIYRFILKGATPVAQDPSVYRKVGAAWNYATGRLPTNNWDRFGRVSRYQR